MGHEKSKGKRPSNVVWLPLVNKYLYSLLDLNYLLGVQLYLKAHQSEPLLSSVTPWILDVMSWVGPRRDPYSIEGGTYAVFKRNPTIALNYKPHLPAY